MRRRRVASACLAAAAALGIGLGPAAAAGARTAARGPALLAKAVVSTPPAADPTSARVPVLAYYYIWFDTGSWRRAKTDYPTAGRYSSDDPDVMRNQVHLAQRAGIDGFIVSWKHTPILDRRLSQLVDIAEQAHFGLTVIYQGLDFHREPLAATTVAADLAFFAATFAKREPFRIFREPLVIWSGTWRFTEAEIAAVTTPLRGTLRILASEKNVAGYQRVAPFVDGDAYYWSSVNPATYRGYLEKLVDMGRAVHADGGTWIAPAAAGFDARLVGGTTVVGRDGGKTLQREIDTALAASPDALGLISWNEFSENSAIEPSVRYGTQALDVVGERFGRGAIGTGASPRAAAGGRATGSARSSWDRRGGLLVLVAFGLLFVASLVVLGRHGRRRAAAHEHPESPSLHVVTEPEAARPVARTRRQVVAARRGRPDPERP